MARKSFFKKNPFADLDEETRNAIASMKDEEIHHRISKAALDQEALEQAKKDDEDLKQKKEAKSVAEAPYREGKKRLRLLIRYSRSILDARGSACGTSPTEGVR